MVLQRTISLQRSLERQPTHSEQLTTSLVINSHYIVTLDSVWSQCSARCHVAGPHRDVGICDGKKSQRFDARTLRPLKIALWGHNTISEVTLQTVWSRSQNGCHDVNEFITRLAVSCQAVCSRCMLDCSDMSAYIIQHRDVAHDNVTLQIPCVHCDDADRMVTLCRRPCHVVTMQLA